MNPHHPSVCCLLCLQFVRGDDLAGYVQIVFIVWSLLGLVVMHMLRMAMQDSSNVRPLLG